MFDSEVILCTAMSKFIYLKLEDGKDPDTLFFEADKLPEVVRRHEETISDCANKNAIIRAVPNSYSDMNFAVRRNHTFSVEQIQSTPRSIYRAVEASLAVKRYGSCSW